MRPWWLALPLSLLLPVAAAAQDAVRSDGALSDRDFYRLVACAATPGAACRKPLLKWEKPEVTVGIVTRTPPYLGGKMKRAEASVVRAAQRLTATGAGLRVVVTDRAPDIAIHLLDTLRGDVIAGSGTPLDGLTLANAITRLSVRGNRIEAAHVGFSRDMTIRQYESVMLEEILQALGLVTDIENPHYQTRSILSQNADNSLKRLGAQDEMALRTHYPRN
ncbi:DUF2927 domain-containing protein [Sulfitobacter sp. HNIBRBA3233]|uniref:DUF2927 domain-containing protein n=1 Tax=Sulfitobacter marinivivus TaxID=3158558 RepID=UPI0032E01E33